jgi:hypothetical protein
MVKTMAENTQKAKNATCIFCNDGGSGLAENEMRKQGNDPTMEKRNFIKLLST